MAIITIDGKEYDTDKLNDEVKAQLASLQFCDVELQRLNAMSASVQTARMAYANALKSQLDKIGTENNLDGSSSVSEQSEKKGLLGGLFGKK